MDFHELNKPTNNVRLATHKFTPALLRLLNEQVVDRFNRISGLTASATCQSVENVQPGQRFDRPPHPMCASQANCTHCQSSWEEHLAFLNHTPNTHWHTCVSKRLCAVIPLMANHSCAALCRFVAPHRMGETAFLKQVELLDLLVENLISGHSKSVELAIEENTKETARTVTERAHRERGLQTESAHPKVLQALAYIDEQLHQTELTVASIAQHLNTNPTYLAHLFSTQVGIRMSRYIAQQRIELAKKLLATTTWQIKRVAFESGHANADWFSQVFRTYTGSAPREYRRKVRQGR